MRLFGYILFMFFIGTFAVKVCQKLSYLWGRLSSDGGMRGIGELGGRVVSPDDDVLNVDNVDAAFLHRFGKTFFYPSQKTLKIKPVFVHDKFLHDEQIFSSGIGVSPSAATYLTFWVDSCVLYLQHFMFFVGLVLLTRHKTNIPKKLSVSGKPFQPNVV
jgi:hypothetical protein